MRKLIISTILSILLSNYALAYDFVIGAGAYSFFFNITSNEEPYTVELTSETGEQEPYNTYPNPSGDLDIPETVEYNNITYTVTRIGDRVFKNCTDLTSVIIPNSITSIGDYAFFGCSGLTTVHFYATNCTTIGSPEYPAFKNCSSLVTFNIGENVRNIPDYALYNCSSITEIHIPDSVRSIGEKAFYGCGMTEITIPDSITSIGEGAFGYCTGLSIVHFNAINCTSMGSSEYPVFEGCSYLDDLYIGEYVTNIPNSAFKNCTSLTTVFLNATNCTIMGNPDYPVFEGCTDLWNIDIYENVTNIPANAFYGCSNEHFTSVTIPNSVTNIGNNAFNGCSSLTTIILGTGVTNIGENAFYGCGMTEITIPNSVTNIGESAFSNCNRLTTVNFNATNCTTMGSSNYPVFEDCPSLTTLNIGENVTNIPDYAFTSCSGVTTINYNATNCTYMCRVDGNLHYSAFENCSSFTLNIGENVESFPDYAFYYCRGMTGDLIIPNSVQTINTQAFGSCNGLTSVTIGSSVTSIWEKAFANCTALTTVNYNASNCINVRSNVYSNCNAFTTLNIGGNVMSIPVNAFYDCSGLSEITIPNSVASIGEYAFFGCSGLVSVTIPSSVTNIDYGAFAECSRMTSVYFTGSLTEWCGISFGDNPLYYAHNLYINNELVTDLVIPNTITEIKYQTFCGASCLTSVTFPESVRKIGKWSFNDCTGLTALTIGNGVDSIGECAFRNCTGISSVTIPNSIKCIEGRTFEGCSGLTAVYYTGNLAEWCGISFLDYSTSNPLDNAHNLYVNGELITDLVIPNTVSEIKQYAFYGATCLTSATFPEPVTRIGYRAFSECSGLDSIALGNSITSIDDGAFEYCTGLTTVTIPPAVDSLGNFAFNGCNALTTVNFNATNCISMGDYYSAFGDCSSFTTLNIGENVTNIPYNSFSECSRITSVIIPNSVTSIGGYAFRLCSGLTSVKIGHGVTSIGEDAFYGCNNIAEIKILANTPPVINENVFTETTYTDAILGVPCGHTDVYAAANVWGSFANIEERFQYDLNVLSNNEQQGTAEITVMPTCSDNTGIITATPATGYRFLSWNDGNTDNPRTVIVTSDSIFTAGFKAVHTITVLANNDAYGIVSGGGTYEEGTEIVIMAMPNSDYCFLSWDDGDSFNPRTITVTSDSTFVAEFSATTRLSIDTTVTKYLTIADRTFYIAGQYSFVVPAEIGCDTIIDLNLRILDEPETYDISPNPAKSLISISSEDYISFVEFYSTAGRLVMRKEINAYQAEINVEELVSGVYFVRLYGEDVGLPSIQRFVKE